MLELLGRREIALPSAGAKTNEPMAKQVHTGRFVFVHTCIV